MPTKPDLDALQKNEYNLWRMLLGLNDYVATAALREGIGASNMETRAMETQLLYIKDTLEGPFTDLARMITHQRETNKGEWIAYANRHLRTLGISFEKMIDMNRIELKGKIKE